MADFSLEDYSDERKQDLEKTAVKALTKAGLIIESSAKTKARFRDGDLRNSIDNKVIPKGTETVVIVGSNLSYFPFHEWGTGEFAENGMDRTYCIRYC